MYRYTVHGSPDGGQIPVTEHKRGPLPWTVNGFAAISPRAARPLVLQRDYLPRSSCVETLSTKSARSRGR
jgi:hypothetical protein